MASRGSQRIARAFFSARARLASKARARPPEDLFDELGETLFWLYAFAEANGKLQVQSMVAMTWARDRIAHGVIAAEPLEFDDGSGLALMMPSREGWG